VALSLALEALGLERGDGAALSTLSPYYYQKVLEERGIFPVYVDAEAGTALMHADGVKWALEHCENRDRVKALIVNETLGFMPDMEALCGCGLPVIEDCSASVFGAIGEKKAGSWGQVAFMGLEERDMLTAGGGALLFAAERRNASALRNTAGNGLPPEYLLPGMNAAMAAVQFREAPKSQARRTEIAGLYTQASQRTRHKGFALTAEFTYNNYAFPLVLETGFKDVAAYAKKKEIDVALAFSNTLAGRGIVESAKYQESASLALRTVLFPLYPRLTSKEAERVTKLIQTLP
jgi:dTDP-4-amino-4,6-dideoxygalactose transaminase